MKTIVSVLILTFHLTTFSQQNSIHWIGAKADMKFTSQNISQDFTAHIRAKIGDTFWMSCTGVLGIEGARMLLLKDTLFIRNNIDQSFSVLDAIDFQNVFQKEFKISQMEECLFIPEYRNDTNDLEEKSLSKKRIVTKYTSDEITKYHFDENGMIAKIIWINKMSQSQLECSYSDYRKDPISNQLFPYSKIMKLVKEDSILFSLNVHYKKLHINKRQPMPFSFQKDEE